MGVSPSESYTSKKSYFIASFHFKGASTTFKGLLFSSCIFSEFEKYPSNEVQRFRRQTWLLNYAPIPLFEYVHIATDSILRNLSYLIILGIAG